MKKVLAIKTPVGGIVQIIPRDDSETAVGLSWREQVLSEAEKESSRHYLFDETPEKITDSFPIAAQAGKGLDFVIWPHDKVGEWADGG